MTQSTEQERAEFEAWAAKNYHGINLEHEGRSYRYFLANEWWTAWQAARRVQVVPVRYVPVTASMGTVQRATEDGWNECVAAMLAAAPQPTEAGLKRENPTSNPEESPVQMPEAVAWMLGCQTMGGDVGWKLSWSKSGAGVCNRLNGEEFEQTLYTEHQVRQLLADHGVK